MKGSLLLLILALCISSAFSDDCDFHITSKTDLESVLADQNWAPATKVLCFAAGTYSYTDGPNYQITAPQVWRGANVNGDPTCSQRVIPPCARLYSAMNFDATVESVIFVSGASNIFLYTTASDFTITGFSITFVTTSANFASGGTITLTYNYISTQGSFSLDQIYANNNYFLGSLSNPLLSTITNGVVHDNYFTNSAAAVIGSYENVESNSFVDNYSVFGISSNLLVSDNLFLLNSIVGTVGSGSVWQDNSLILNDQVISINTPSYTLSTTGNCFMDNNTPLSFLNGDFIGNDHSGNNYFGLPHLAQGGFFDTGSGQLGSPEQTPPVFSSPLVCPKTFFSVFVLHNKAVTLGQPMDVYWTFKTGTSLLASGLDLSILNQTTITFNIYDDQFDSAASFKTLSLTDTAYFNKFGVAYNSLSFTPHFTDFATSPMHGRANNYTLVAHVAFTTNILGTPLSHTFFAADSIRVSFNIPEECRNRNDVVDIPKTARFNGPVTLNLTDLFCDTVQWNISAIDQQPLHAPPVSVNADNSVTFTISPSTSGLFNFVLNITSFSSPDLVHRLFAKVNIINTRPYVTPYRYFNFTQLSEVGNVNLLFNSSDADSDTVTIKSIYPRGDKNFTNIDDLSVYFHFNGTGFVVVSDASGNLSIHDVDLTNPSIPATGGAFSGKFKYSFGINFVATDGDRSNQNAEGSVVFHHIHPSS